MVWNPALEGGRRVGGAVAGCVQPPVHTVAPFCSLPWIPQAEQLEGICSWGWNTHTADSETINPSCQMVYFWYREKFVPPRDQNTFLRECMSFFLRPCPVHIPHSAHPTGLYSAPTFNVLCTFDSKVLGWGLRNTQCERHPSKKKMFRAAGCLEGVHWKAHKSYHRKSTLKNACLVVKYPRILCHI